MVDKRESPGCRGAATATFFLLGSAVVFMTVGLTLARSETCTGLCETGALALLYAGGPISGMLGVLFGDLWLAWPLEVTLWVVLGFVTARWAERRSHNIVAVSVVVIVFALIYGLVLSQFVEMTV